MEDANALLFIKTFNGKPLFKSQLDLVLQLLNDRDTKYYIDNGEQDQYLKAQSRLKTYISQLLSATAIRNITEDFKSGLLTVIVKKLKDPVLSSEIVGKIIEDLKVKNSEVIKTEPKNSIFDEFTSDFHSANYIAIITSKPLEVEARLHPDTFSLRQILFNDFLDCLTHPDKDVKNYRFNFPLDTTAFLFWKGLKKILFKYLNKEKYNHSLFDLLYNKFALKTKTLEDLKGQEKFTEEYLNAVVDEMLELLNRNRYVMVFVVNAPIYAMPLIVLNPAETKNFKLYALLDDGKVVPSVYKYTNEDNVLWRLFVWDKLKSKQYAGTDIRYKSIDF